MSDLKSVPAPSAKPRLDGWRFRWDVVVLLAFVVAAMRHWTDLAWHEVLGVVVVPVVGVHAHWIWSKVRKPQSTVWVLLVVAAVVGVMRSPLMRQRGRFRDDAIKVTAAVVPAAFIAFGALLVFRRRGLRQASEKF